MEKLLKKNLEIFKYKLFKYIIIAILFQSRPCIGAKLSFSMNKWNSNYYKNIRFMDFLELGKTIGQNIPRSFVFRSKNYFTIKIIYHSICIFISPSLSYISRFSSIFYILQIYPHPRENKFQKRTKIIPIFNLEYHRNLHRSRGDEISSHFEKHL